MEFERLPTVPTADEILDRSFRRAAKKRKEKINKDRANEEFVRAVKSAIHDRLVYIIRGFPEFDTLPRFYREMADILFGLDKIRKSLGAVGWAAKHTGMVGGDLAFKARKSDDPVIVRRQAVARIASIVHQIDDDLRFLNDVRMFCGNSPISRMRSRLSSQVTRMLGNHRLSGAYPQRPRRLQPTRSRQKV